MKSTSLSVPKQSTALTALDAEEIALLINCEATITRCMDQARRSFLEAGEALATIRDNRLYRATQPTFEAYCRQQWKIGRSYANKQIAAAAVAKSLGTRVPILPTTEAQVRPLLQFAPEDQPAVWQLVVKRAGVGEGETLIASKVRDIINTQIQLSDDSPFKGIRSERRKRKLAKNREFRESWAVIKRKAEVLATQEAEPPEKIAWRFRAIIKTRIDSWRSAYPAVSSNLLAIVLRQIADELDEALVVTCPTCGAHEADDDGDCAKCREPNITTVVGPGPATADGNGGGGEGGDDA